MREQSSKNVVVRFFNRIYPASPEIEKIIDDIQLKLAEFEIKLANHDMVNYESLSNQLLQYLIDQKQRMIAINNSNNRLFTDLNKIIIRTEERINSSNAPSITVSPLKPPSK